LQVALKALSLRGLRDWKQLELFQREAVVLQGLAHPGIPAYIDYFEEDTANDRAFYIVQASGLGVYVSS
jgi:serine/threonine protein kinase